MARLIDSDKRIAGIKNQYCTGCDNYGGVRCRACWVDDAICLIDDAPTVDAVEVVRCKDCKYRKDPENRFCNSYCTKHFSMQAKDGDFCSYGERKYGDGNG